MWFFPEVALHLHADRHTSITGRTLQKKPVMGINIWFVMALLRVRIHEVFLTGLPLLETTIPQGKYFTPTDAS